MRGLPTGGYLIFQESRPDTGWDLRVLEVDASGRPLGAPRVFANTPFHESSAAISRDGRWVAYESDELDGVVQVYVRSFPDGAHKVRASPTGGRWPAWDSNGNLHYWQTTDDTLRAVHTTEKGGLLLVGTAQAVWRNAVDPAVLKRVVITLAPRALRPRARRHTLSRARERSCWFRSGALASDDRPRVGDAAALMELTMRDGEQYVPRAHAVCVRDRLGIVLGVDDALRPRSAPGNHRS